MVIKKWYHHIYSWHYWRYINRVLDLLSALWRSLGWPLPDWWWWVESLFDLGGWGCHGDLHGSPIQGHAVVLLKGLHSVAPPVINDISCAKGSPGPVNTKSCWLIITKPTLFTARLYTIEFFAASFYILQLRVFSWFISGISESVML